MSISYENNKSKFIEKDIAKVTKEELLKLYGDASIKVLAGCAPCQPFSKYTQGKDKAEDKNGLFFMSSSV